MFGPVEPQPLLDAIRKAIRLHADPKLWRAMQLRGMAADVGWDTSAGLYADLYNDLTRN